MNKRKKRRERVKKRKSKEKKRGQELEKTDQGKESSALRKQTPGRSSAQADMQQCGAPKTVNIK